MVQGYKSIPDPRLRSQSSLNQQRDGAVPLSLSITEPGYDSISIHNTTAS